MMSLSLDLTSLKHPILPRVLHRLPEAKTQLLLVFNALLEKTGKLSGPSFHAHLAALLHSAVKDETDLREWLSGRFGDLPGGRGQAFRAAREQARRWVEDGRWVAVWGDDHPPSDGAPACPQVLFGKGTIETDQRWAAVFNSRKPKLVSPGAEWLQMLRTVLGIITTHELGLASSLGTASYDLVTAGAELAGARLLLLVPQLLEKIGQAGDSRLSLSTSYPVVALTCLTRVVSCPKATRMVCRDRLLAFIADLHCLLDLRPGGNLQSILERQQQERPRLQLRLRLEDLKPGKVAERLLGSSCSRRGGESSGENPGVTQGSQAKAQRLSHSGRLLEPGAIQWGEYLYHYTRSCPGAWPGQSYRSYLESLLQDEPLAEHSALSALVRIVAEGCIRAGCRVVRGDHKVVSWTSRPPQELSAIRHWNAALIRWTFEPYGLAVKRAVLRSLGAKPAIYAAAAVYRNLPQEERFRFQLHDPPRCSWKNEHEWRLPHDLKLAELTSDEAFLFLPTLADAAEFAGYTASDLPIVVLG